MRRTVERELLDELPSSDSRAVQARRDLQKVNAWMGHARILARGLRSSFSDQRPRSLVELGAGDGTLLLNLVRAMAPRWEGGRGRRAGRGDGRVVLVDRQRLISRETQSAFEGLGWSVKSVQMDVCDWLREPPVDRSDVIIANLFLHHFVEDDLTRLLRLVATHTRLFLACEPRRDQFSLRASDFLWLIGCNDVTKHDARVSVRAGFTGTDLTTLWPGDGRWRLFERRAGAFSHSFGAQLVGDGTS